MFPQFCGIKCLWTIFVTGQRQSFSERTYFWRNTTLDATVWGKYGMLWFLSTIMFLHCRQLKVLTPQIWRHHVFRFTFYNMSNFMFSERTYFDGTPTSKIWLCGTEKLKGQLQSFYPKCLELGWEFINKIPLTLVLLRVFPKHIFLRGVVATPLWIINTEGHITLNLLPVYRYGHPLSIDTKISTNH